MYNNIYNGNFTDRDKQCLENFDGFTFWMVEDRYSPTGLAIYAKHESWNASQRKRANSAFDMYMSLNIAAHSGGY